MKSILKYKKPQLWIMIAAIAVCAIMVVCFLTSPLKGEDAGAVSAKGDNGGTQPTEIGSIQESQPYEQPETDKDSISGWADPSEETPIKKSPIQELPLYEQPEAGKVCIQVEPSMVRKCNRYYYIPTGEAQEWLSEQINALNLEWEPAAKRWEGHKDAGWVIVYDKDVWMLGSVDGYLYCSTIADDGVRECLVEAPELCSYIQNMVEENAGYQNYDASNIKNIVSAKLDYSIEGQIYSQTITDAETLKKFEEWFSNAEYEWGGCIDCGNAGSCLELTMADGDVVRMSMSTDGCSNFTIDGVGYSYWNNSDSREFYECFDEIPRKM